MQLKLFFSANSTQFSSKDFKVLCPFHRTSRYLKGSNICHLSWTSKGVLLTNKNKSQIRINEIINTLKTMDNHFGKQKFRSGNIPFSMFGPFDQKSNVLFKDSTDSLKTKYEIGKVTNFERGLESYLNEIIDSTQFCSGSHSVHISFVTFVIIALLLVLKPTLY